MLGFIGGALFVLLLLYACLLRARQQEKRVRECEGFLQLVRHIRAEIATFHTPLDRALARFENAALEEAGVLALARTRGLCAALFEKRDTLCLAGEERKVMLAFAEGVGRSYRAEAIALCERTENLLAASLEKEKREAPARVRAGNALLLFGGLSLLLLLG